MVNPAQKLNKGEIITIGYAQENNSQKPSKIYFPSGMNLAGHFSKIDGSNLELTHEELDGMSMMRYRWGSIKNPLLRGLPWRGQRTYDISEAGIKTINPTDFELVEEFDGLQGKLHVDPGDLIQIIHFDNDTVLDVVGYVTRHEVSKVRISHLNPQSFDDKSKRLPIWTDHLPGIDARHGDKTFSLREFSSYRILK